MTALPASGYFEDSSRTVGEMKQALEDQRDFISEAPGGNTASELTISSGSVTPTTGIHTIDTEGDASSDDLANIITTNLEDGRLLFIRAENSARTVVVKHNAGGAGQISLVDSADYSLDDTEKWILLKRTGTDWEEIMRGVYPTYTGTLTGNVNQASGGYVTTDQVKAVDSDGLLLEDDGGNGIKVNDGGVVDMSMQSGCSVYLNTTQAITTSTVTKVQLDTEDYDIQNEFDSTTNYRFTAGKAGKYMICGNVGFDSLADGNSGALYIYKNGSVVSQVTYRQGVTGNVRYPIMKTISLAASDYVELHVYHNYGSNRNLLTGVSVTFLTIQKVA